MTPRSTYMNNKSTHKSINNEQGRQRFYERSTHFPYRSTYLSPRSTHMHNRSRHMNNRSTHVSHRLTHFQKNEENKPFKHVMGIHLDNERTKKNNTLIYNTKVQLKNQESKSISVKQTWIPKCLFNVLDTLKDLNGTKQLWVPKSSI